MRLLVLSDLHLEFGCFIPRETNADAVILAGDTDLGVNGIENARRLWPDIPVIYVLGNHEFYQHRIPSLIDEARRQARGSNVVVLENDSAVIHGVRFLGCALWTDFMLFGKKGKSRAMQSARMCMNDFSQIQTDAGRVFDPEDSISYHQESLRWLTGALKEANAKEPVLPTVVVTHHCPSQLSVADCFRQDPISAAFASRLEDIVSSSGARLWVHGHTHHPFDYNLGQTRVVCNPRGYPFEGDKGFNRALIIEV